MAINKLSFDMIHNAYVMKLRRHVHKYANIIYDKSMMF